MVYHAIPIKGRTVSAQVEVLMGWMGSLADPTLLRLMRVLEKQAFGVAELCEVLQFPRSTVSRHLKVAGGRGVGCAP
jgi:DNA-binding transcriptional ArsR family regulator